MSQLSSPTLTRNNFGINFQSQNYQDQMFTKNWNIKNYAPPLLPSLPPPPHARPTTPVSLIDADIEIAQQCRDSDNLIKQSCRNNNTSQNFLQYIGQQQRTVQR